MDQKCAAIIPCYNEAAEIGRVVAAVKKFVRAVIVIDDGSTDDTGQVASGAGAEVLALTRNSGKGAALRAGWRRAGARKFEWVLMVDGDGQHSADDIPKFFERAEATGARLIVGKRTFDKIPPFRQWVNRYMSAEISRLAGTEMPDTQCGFRLAEIETLMRLPLAAEHFEIESEMLVAQARAGGKVEFVPIQTIYKNGTSKIRPVRDTLRWLRWRLGQSKATEADILLAPTGRSKTSFAD